MHYQVHHSFFDILLSTELFWSYFFDHYIEKILPYSSFFDEPHKKILPVSSFFTMRLAGFFSKKQFYCGNGRILGLNQYTFNSAADMIIIWAVTLMPLLYARSCPITNKDHWSRQCQPRLNSAALEKGTRFRSTVLTTKPQTSYFMTSGVLWTLTCIHRSLTTYSLLNYFHQIFWRFYTENLAPLIIFWWST